MNTDSLAGMTDVMYTDAQGIIQSHKTKEALRDYFAANALVGILSDIKSYQLNIKNTTYEHAIATDCYVLADAMMKARNIR